MTDNRKTGNRGEELACRHLKSKGCRIIARNFSCRSGEIDIVAELGDTIIFAEVKTRSGTDMGLPCQAVNFSKQKKIRRTAEFFLHSSGRYSGFQPRFDIIEVLISDGRAYLRHLENAF